MFAQDKIMELSGLGNGFIASDHLLNITTGGSSSGTILLQRGVVQVIAIPVTGNVVEEFLNKIAAQEGVGISTLITAVDCYRVDINKYLSYVVGHTLDSSVHNFPLMYSDNGSMEIVALRVKCKQWEHTNDDISFIWNNN